MSNDKDVEGLEIIQTNQGFRVKLFYTNGKSTDFLCEGYDLSKVFKAVDRQNKEIHRMVLHNG